MQGFTKQETTNNLMKVGYANLGEKYTVNFFVLGLSLYN